uniref:F-box protein 16 n=1 Tax=Neogobius melanostomus TaxID=47308 RepID=A0A8C6TSF9_9GOBI
MPHAPKTSVNSAKMQTKRSAWTPLNHAPSNSQIFEERRALLAKWFSRWTDGQRKTVLEDLMRSCSLDQLLLLISAAVHSPVKPSGVTVCRAQVSWRWKDIVDLDQLWRVKCVRRGWYLDFSPNQFEASVWKRHYINTVELLYHETNAKETTDSTKAL